MSAREQQRQALDAVVEAFLDWQESEDNGTEVGVVTILAEMRAPDGTTSTPVFYCSDARRWVQAGLFRACLRAVEGAPE